MTHPLTAEIAALAADVQQRAADLADRAAAAVPAGHISNEYLRYLDLAADLLRIARDEITADGLYLRLDDGTTDLDTADPDSVRVDELLAAELVKAGA